MKRVRYKSLAFLGFPRYRIGSDGSLWRWLVGKNEWRRLRFGDRKKLYNEVVLCHDGKRGYFAVAVLVLTAFRGSKPIGCLCRHLNGQSKDNRLSNLRWGTPTENQHDRRRHGTIVLGEASPLAKLTAQDVRRIRRLYKSKRISQYQLAERYRVTQGAICAIVTRRTWSHIP